MIDQAQVEHIKKYGVPGDEGEGRLAVLRDQIGFPMDQPAEYVIIAGCFQPGAMPDVLASFKEVLDRLELSYTMLSKEYCCGWMPIGQPAVMMKNEEDIKAFKETSKEFVRENFKQAKDLGAKSLAFFCAACEPNYSNCKDETDIEFVSYVEMLNRHFQGGTLDREIDYYAGCYRFRRKITEEPIDVDHGANLLKKIDGLKVNAVDNKLCCYIPPHLDQLGESIRADELVAICTGCYHNLKSMLQGNENLKVSMLPELVLEAL